VKKIVVIIPIVLIVMAVALAGIGQSARNHYRQQLDELYSINMAGGDLFEVAVSTSRASLGPVASNITEIKRQLQDVDVMDDLEPYQQISVQVVDKELEMLLIFMNDTEATLERELGEVANLGEARNNEYLRAQARTQESIWAWGFSTIF
jgi:hypothetical protein